MAADDKETLAEARTRLAEDRTILANERTFAGWMRTGFAAVGIGLPSRRRPGSSPTTEPLGPGLRRGTGKP